MLRSSSPTIRGERSETVSSKDSSETITLVNTEDLQNLDPNQAGEQDNQKISEVRPDTATVTPRSDDLFSIDTPDGVVIGERGEGEGQEEERECASRQGSLPPNQTPSDKNVAKTLSDGRDRLASSKTIVNEDLSESGNRYSNVSDEN